MTFVNVQLIWSLIAGVNIKLCPLPEGRTVLEPLVALVHAMLVWY
jgi:hypothetical protein